MVKEFRKGSAGQFLFGISQAVSTSSWMGLDLLKSSTGLQSKMALWRGCQMGAQLGRSARMPGQGLPHFDMLHGGWLPLKWHPKRTALEVTEHHFCHVQLGEAVTNLPRFKWGDIDPKLLYTRTLKTTADPEQNSSSCWRPVEPLICDVLS